MERRWLLGMGLFVALFGGVGWRFGFDIEWLGMLIALAKIPLEVLVLQRVLGLSRVAAVLIGVLSGIGLALLMPAVTTELNPAWGSPGPMPPADVVPALVLAKAALLASGLFALWGLFFWQIGGPTKEGSKAIVGVQLTAVGLAMMTMFLTGNGFIWIERNVEARRRMAREQLPLHFTTYARDHGRLPEGKNAEEALWNVFGREVPGGARLQLPIWLAVYEPHYRLYDQGESRRRPFAWNPEIAGKRLEEIPEGVTWLCRSPSDERQWVMFVEKRGDQLGVRTTTLPHAGDRIEDQRPRGPMMKLVGDTLVPDG